MCMSSPYSFPGKHADTDLFIKVYTFQSIHELQVCLCTPVGTGCKDSQKKPSASVHLSPKISLKTTVLQRLLSVIVI